MFIPTLSFCRTGGGLEEDWRKIAGGLDEEEDEEEDCRRTRG